MLHGQALATPSCTCWWPVGAAQFGVEARVRTEPLDDGNGQAVRFFVEIV